MVSELHRHGDALALIELLLILIFSVCGRLNKDETRVLGYEDASKYFFLTILMALEFYFF